MYIGYVEISNVYDRNALSSEIQEGSSELSILTGEYIQYHRERPKGQWLTKHASLGVLLSTYSDTSKTDIEIIEFKRLESQYIEVKEVFLRLIALNETENFTDRTAPNTQRELEARLTTQLLSSLHTMSGLSSNIERQFTKRMERTIVDLLKIIAITFFALLLLFIGAWTLITRRIAQPMTILRSDIDTISAGNLDHRVTRKYHDEFGSVANHINDMVINLKEIMVSRDTLKVEIAQHKKTQEELNKTLEFLAEANNLLETAQKIGHTGGWEWHIPSNKLRWSNEAFRIFGLKPQEFIATYDTYLAAVHPDDREKVSKSIEDALNGHRPYNLNHRIVWPDGTERIVHERGEVRLDESGKPTRMIGTVQDITERKRSEELITRLGNIVEKSLNEVYIFDAQTLGFIQVNYGARSNLGYTLEEMRELTPLDIKPKFTMETFEEAIRPLRNGEKEFITFKTLHQRKDGNHYDVEVNLQLMRHESPPVFVAIIQDITERIRMEEALRQSEKMASIGGLASGMAHELNNPLGGIVQGAQNVARRLSPELAKNIEVANELGIDLNQTAEYLKKRKIPQLFESISEAGARASEIVNSMRDLARNTRGEKASANLTDMIENTIRLAGIDYDLKHTYHFKDIEVVRDFEPSLPMIHCQADEIERAILAVLRNAAQAMVKQDPPSRITVRIRSHNHRACIEIEDNGPGMESKVLNRIFEPFFTTESPQKRGLGLSTAYSIICDIHGGQMNAKSVPGKGTTIFIELPFAIVN